MPDINLSEPWYTFANQVKYTYGASPCVTVNELIENNGSYVLTINTCAQDVANALRAVLPLTKTFGNVVVDIVIFSQCGKIVPVSNQVYTPELLAETICTALHKNPLFVGTLLTDGKIPDPLKSSIGDVVVIIQKAVIQFFNDDISDLCSNYTEVASKVFATVTNLQYPVDLLISFSSYDCNCKLQKDIYCPNNTSC